MTIFEMGNESSSASPLTKRVSKIELEGFRDRSGKTQLSLRSENVVEKIGNGNGLRERVPTTTRFWSCENVTFSLYL